MKVKPASVHLRAKAGFSLNWIGVSARTYVSGVSGDVVQSHSLDVCPGNPVP